MTSPRQDLGAALWRLSDLVRADERSRSFRAKAYRRAVWSLDDLNPDMSNPPEEVLSIPGIGEGVLRLIEEFRSGGHLEALDRLERLYPVDVARMRRLPRMTPAILRSLKGELGIETASDLVAAVEAGGVEALKGVGPATAERWVRILQLAPTRAAIPAFQASVLADALGHHLRRHLGGEVEAAGSVRRMEEWVEIVALVAGMDDVVAGNGFLESTAVARFIGHGPKGETTLRAHEGVGLEIHLVTPSQVGARLVEVTGPPDHAVELLAEVEGEPLTETEIYASSGRVWIPPPARSLPSATAGAVVRLGEIRGDLHLHSDGSPDGRMSLTEIARGAVDRQYEYVLVTDHTSGLRFGGLDEEALASQQAEIEEIRAGFPDLLVLHGAELNIGRDGSLDIDDAALDRLDLAVAGLHSYFDLDRSEQTARVLKTLSHPVVRILAHPTGRRIGARPAIDLDIEAVISSAIENDVALEVNGHRDRLDLSATLAAQAVAAGAFLAANSDSHRPGEMGNIANSVATMQRAGVGPASVVNTMPVDRFRGWASRLGDGFRAGPGG
jgi:DNA polymerase (family X)